MKAFAAAAVSALLVAGAEGYSEAVKNVAGNMGTDRVIQVPYSSLSKEARDILADVDEFGNTVEGIDMKVSFQTVSALESAGVQFSDKTDAWIQELSTNFENANFVCQDGAVACAAAEDFYTKYQRLDALHERLDTIAADSNGVAEIDTFGNSYEGRNQKIIKISSGTFGDKPIVFFFCGIHAREWLPPAFCTYMAETLAAGHELLDKVDFLISPVTNPDGYEYSHTTNNMWRKSRKPNQGFFFGRNCDGTDLNRNYDAHFCETGASSNPCSETYCGKAPFDNVETANLRDYIVNLINSGKTILMDVDVHAYGQMWMSSYGWTKDLPPDYEFMNNCGKAAGDAIESVNGKVFEVGSIANVIYTVAGGSNDYFYETHGIKYGYGIEVREKSFQPSPTNIIPSNLEMFEGMKAAVLCAYSQEYENDNGGGGNGGDNGDGGDNGGDSGGDNGGDEEDGCQDRVPSGLTWSSSGRPAECDELGSYCERYEVVRERCPRTCGLCTRACRDNEPSGLRFDSGNPASCSEVEQYCNRYEAVRTACPKTCEVCVSKQISEVHAAKYAPEEVLLISIDENLEEESSGAMVGAIAIAGMGFLGALTALFTVYRRYSKLKSENETEKAVAQHYI